MIQISVECVQPLFSDKEYFEPFLKNIGWFGQQWQIYWESMILNEESVSFLSDFWTKLFPFWSVRIRNIVNNFCLYFIFPGNGSPSYSLLVTTFSQRLEEVNRHSALVGFFEPTLCGALLLFAYRCLQYFIIVIISCISVQFLREVLCLHKYCAWFKYLMFCCKF